MLYYHQPSFYEPINNLNAHSSADFMCHNHDNMLFLHFVPAVQLVWITHVYNACAW